MIGPPENVDVNVVNTITEAIGEEQVASVAAKLPVPMSLPNAAPALPIDQLAVVGAPTDHSPHSSW